MKFKCFVATVVALSMCSVQASAQTTHTLATSGNIGDPLNWDTGLLAVEGDTAIINIDANWPSTSNASILAIDGDLIIGGGTTLTAAIDIVASSPNSISFNDVTVNVADDIFPGGATGNFIFNTGSVTDVNDDFESNGGGTITINGGTHTVGDQFGAQRGSVLNFLGGSVTSGGFRTTEGNAGTPAGGTINIGGDATINAGTLSLDASGFIDFATDWTGSLTIANVSDANALFDALNGTTATFGGAELTQTVFDNNFEFSNGSLSAVPTTTVLLGDVNCDGTVDFLDITPFIGLLSSGGFKAQADIDESEEVDFLDITPFIAILSGG